MDASSSGRSIVITGASRGIGAALARHYAQPGTCLGLISRDAEELAAVARACEQKGATVHPYVGDVRDSARMKACARDFMSRTAVVDIVIANAGIRLEEDEDVQDTGVARELVETNYLGTVNTLSPFIPVMKAQRSGRLAVVSSIGAIRATPNSGAYSASKAAVNLWTEGLRLRLSPFGVSVTCLCSGFVDTAMTQTLPFWMPGLLTPEAAARIIARAVERRRRSVIFPWQSRLLWQFFAMLPGPLYDSLILWAKAHHPHR